MTHTPQAGATGRTLFISVDVRCHRGSGPHRLSTRLNNYDRLRYGTFNSLNVRRFKGATAVTSAEQGSVASKINALIAERWAGQKPPGNAVIAKAIRDETGLSISTGYLWMLRTGQRGNPTGPRLQALARFFGKPPAYFLDEDVTNDDMELASALHSQGVRMIALRSNGLSERSQRAILDMIERAREIEQLDEEQDTTPNDPPPRG